LFFHLIRTGGRAVFYLLYLVDDVLYQTNVHHHKQKRQKHVNCPFGNIGHRRPRVIDIYPFGQSIEAGEDDTVKNNENNIIKYQQYQSAPGPEPVQHDFQPQMLVSPDGGGGTEINGQNEKYQGQFFGPGKGPPHDIAGKNLQEQQYYHDAHAECSQIYLEGIERFYKFFHFFSLCWLNRILLQRLLE
jgi:hypothetical protein